MNVYVCLYVRLFPFVFITIHAQLVIKKCSIKTHSYFSTYKVYFKHHLQIQILTQEMTSNSNPSSFEFKITFKPWLNELLAKPKVIDFQIPYNYRVQSFLCFYSKF
jgi:hypothetical protein